MQKLDREALILIAERHEAALRMRGGRPDRFHVDMRVSRLETDVAEIARALAGQEVVAPAEPPCHQGPRPAWRDAFPIGWWLAFPGSEKVDLGDKHAMACFEYRDHAETYVKDMWPGIGHMEQNL